MSSYNHFGCSWCGGPFNGGNCPGCSSVGSRNEFVYDRNPYSYNETLNFFNQPPQHQFETYSSDSCRGDPHYGFDCQTWASLVYEQDPCNNQNFSYDQPPYYSSSLPQQYPCCEYCGGPHDSYDCQSNNQSPLYGDMSLHEMLIRLTAYLEESSKRQKQSFDEFKILCDNFWSEIERNKVMNINAQITKPSVDYFDDDYTMVTIILPPAIALHLPLLLTKKPLDTLLMGDEVISTTLERKNDEFIKSSVDDLVPIPRESEVTSVCDLECNMPITTHFPTTDVREEKLDINLPLGEHLDTLSMGDREIDFNPSRDIEELERLLADDSVPVPRVFDEPLGNSDSVPRSYDVTFSKHLFDFNDDYTLCYDNLLFNEEFENISSLDLLNSTPVIDESTLLVTPLPDSKQIYLRGVERFDPFFSLTQSGNTTWVMEIPSYRFPHMPSPRPAAYSPREAQKWTEHETKKAKMMEEYKHQISFRADQLPIIKISYVVHPNKEATMKITRGDNPLNLVVIDQAKKLGLPLPSALATFGMTTKEKKRNMKQFLKEVFVTENITVDGICSLSKRRRIPSGTTVQLIRIQKLIQRGTPEADEMFRKLELTIKARDDVAQAREKDNLDD
nr:NAC domain-containing protein [Tanacetum cinerariifolium]